MCVVGYIVCVLISREDKLLVYFTQGVYCGSQDEGMGGYCVYCYPGGATLCVVNQGGTILRDYIVCVLLAGGMGRQYCYTVHSIIM